MIRLEKKLKAGVTAQQVGVCPSFYNYIEMGDHLPSYTHLEKLAHIFGMKLSRLIQRHEERMGL